jgi:hypothetical protein
MWPWNSATQGHVYILHLDRPLGNLANRRAQALHYCGFAEDLAARLEKHAAGKGSKLTAAALNQGIAYHVYAWPASLAVEKLLKAYKKTAVFCPSCAAGKIARPLPVAPPLLQQALALDEPIPELPGLVSMDWLEMSIQRSWRAIRLPAPAGIDEDLL